MPVSEVFFKCCHTALMHLGLQNVFTGWLREMVKGPCQCLVLTLMMIPDSIQISSYIKSLHTGAFSWAFSSSGLTTRRLGFSHRLGMCYEWRKSTVSLKPLTTRFCLTAENLPYRLIVDNVAVWGCSQVWIVISCTCLMRVLIFTIKALIFWTFKWSLWNCQLSLFLPRFLALLQTGLSLLELHRRVSLHMKSHSQGEGINKQTRFGWHTGSLLSHSMKIPGYDLCVWGVCMQRSLCPPTIKKQKTSMLDIRSTSAKMQAWELQLVPLVLSCDYPTAFG